MIGNIIKYDVCIEDKPKITYQAGLPRNLSIINHHAAIPLLQCGNLSHMPAKDEADSTFIFRLLFFYSIANKFSPS